MPTYVYRCKNDHTFDAWASWENRNAPQICPVCHEPAARDFASYIKRITLQVPMRHRADREIEITRIVVGENAHERERFKRGVETGKLVHESQISDYIVEKERQDREFETSPRITRELWEEAKRLTDGGKHLPKELTEASAKLPDFVHPKV